MRWLAVLPSPPTMHGGCRALPAEVLRAEVVERSTLQLVEVLRGLEPTSLSRPVLLSEIRPADLCT